MIFPKYPDRKTPRGFSLFEFVGSMNFFNVISRVLDSDGKGI